MSQGLESCVCLKLVMLVMCVTACNDRSRAAEGLRSGVAGLTDYYCVNLILWEDGFCALSHESCIGARVRETARSDFLYRVLARVFESARYKVGREL